MAMNEEKVVSTRFPYLPIHLQVRDRSVDLEALLDTGFDGYVVVPSHTVTNGKPADLHLTWTLADGSEVIAPTYRGTARIGNFPQIQVLVSVLGDEPIVGRSLINHFSVILDHGDEIIVKQ